MSAALRRPPMGRRARQGDFVAVLMEGLGETLSARAGSLSEYVLAGRLDAAVRASSAQFDDPDTLGRLRVRLGRATSSETGAPPPALPGARRAPAASHREWTPASNTDALLPASLHPLARAGAPERARRAPRSAPQQPHVLL